MRWKEYTTGCYNTRGVWKQSSSTEKNYMRKKKCKIERITVKESENIGHFDSEASITHPCGKRI